MTQTYYTSGLSSGESLLTPFNNTQISETSSIVNLGVTMNKSLSWNEHVYNLISKAHKRMFILNHFRSILPRIALELIYTSMICLVLEFGVVNV